MRMRRCSGAGPIIRIASLRKATKGEERDTEKKPDDISQEDWDAVDSPPLTSEFIARMRPSRERMAPHLYEKLVRSLLLDGRLKGTPVRFNSAEFSTSSSRKGAFRALSGIVQNFEPILRKTPDRRMALSGLTSKGERRLQ
jgi:hypothetical protein